MSLHAAASPPISKVFYEQLVAAFPALRAVPNVTTEAELMHNAGSLDVIDWIRIHAKVPRS